jgi:L-rhamnose mutarotase
MKRAAMVIRLKPERREEYLGLHLDVLPEMLAALHDTGHRNVSIFLHGDLLFLYFEFEVDGIDARRAAMRRRPELQRWMEITADCQEPLPDRSDGGWWSPMMEVFHLD